MLDLFSEMGGLLHNRVLMALLPRDDVMGIIGIISYALGVCQHALGRRQPRLVTQIIYQRIRSVIIPERKMKY